MLGEERAIVLMDTRGVGGDITAAIGRDAPHPFPIIGMPGIDSIKRAVEMGLGVGVIPRSAASGANSHQALVAIPLSGARATTMTLIYRKTDRISKATSAFVEAMRESRRSPNASGEAFR
jgi:DNA-binding transcriptional LysR family regulator